MPVSSANRANLRTSAPFAAAVRKRQRNNNVPFCRFADLRFAVYLMERKYRLRLNADFQRVRRAGKSWANHLIVLCALPGDLGHSRFGFAASKRIGKAVVRNRVRRRMREAVRLRRTSIAEGWDMVFIARPAIARASYTQISHAIEDLLKRANLYRPLNSENGSR